MEKPMTIDIPEGFSRWDAAELAGGNGPCRRQASGGAGDDGA